MAGVDKGGRLCYTDFPRPCTLLRGLLLWGYPCAGKAAQSMTERLFLCPARPQPSRKREPHRAPAASVLLIHRPSVRPSNATKPLSFCCVRSAQRKTGRGPDRTAALPPRHLRRLRARARSQQSYGFVSFEVLLSTSFDTILPSAAAFVKPFSGPQRAACVVLARRAACPPWHRSE